MVSQLVRLLLRRETDLSEIVSAVAAILWAVLARPVDFGIFDALPGVAAISDPLVQSVASAILATGGILQLTAVLRDMPRLRRACALGAAATWSCLGVCRAVVTGHYGPGVLDIVLAGAQSLAYVKMGRPHQEER